ncbi:MAG: hypothetical protein ABJB05_13885 [Parafilimonas sp.]
METNTTALQQEIERLNIIISALAQQNVQLKNEILWLKQTAGSQNSADYSSTKIPDRLNTSDYSFNKNDDGINSLNTSFTKNADKENESVYSASKINEGINNSNYSITENNKGIINAENSIPKNNEGIKHINIALVQRGLRTEMKTRSYATIDKASRILVLLYENPTQPHKTLMHITGLSQDGMAKHIMMLKRKALVVRTAFQTYTLTQKSINIIKDAMQ